MGPGAQPQASPQAALLSPQEDSAGDRADKVSVLLRTTDGEQGQQTNVMPSLGTVFPQMELP